MDVFVGSDLVSYVYMVLRQTLDSCEYIWAAGVGFATKTIDNPSYDLNRRELLRLLETCFSQGMYEPPGNSSDNNRSGP